MEHTTASKQYSSALTIIDTERLENPGRWKAVRFPEVAGYDFSEPNKILKREWYDYAKEDKFDDFFNLLLERSSSEVLDIIFKHVAVSGNSLLHVAASHGSKGFTQLLCHHFPLLITRTNFHGDNALHLAVRARQLETIKDLVNQVKIHYKESMLRMKNDKGNTPLHDAVIKGFQEVGGFLISEDPEVSYYKNRDDKSPLYLAVESLSEEMLASLVEAISGDQSPVVGVGNDGNLAALQQIAVRKPDLMLPADEKEGNALHLAASMGFLFGAKLLVSRCPMAATQRNQEGNLPIHVACKKGHIDVVRELLTYWFDPADFLNEKGQNILHVAAKNGQTNIVKEILNNHHLEALIDEKDHDGNTPMQLAKIYFRPLAMLALTKKKSVRKSEKLTPAAKFVRLAFSETSLYDLFHEQLEILDSIGKQNEALLKDKPKPAVSVTNAEISGSIGNLLVVAVLVTGVTFTGAITLPAGGSDHHKSGTSKHLMNAYIFFDMLAMNLSVIAAMILAGLPVISHSTAAKILKIASAYIFFSLLCMGLAFTFALTVTVKEHSTFFRVLIAFHCLFIALQYLLCSGMGQMALASITKFTRR